MSHIISIDEIENSEAKTVYYSFNDKIEGINSDGAISAELKINALDEFIEVSGNINGTLKLVCDRCLKEFNYDLDFDIDEVFAKHSLAPVYGQETEIKDGQFITDLNGASQIDIYDLLYQSVIINLPNKKVCGINCNGDNFLKEEELSDPRMDVFKNIQIQPKK